MASNTLSAAAIDTAKFVCLTFAFASVATGSILKLQQAFFDDARASNPTFVNQNGDICYREFTDAKNNDGLLTYHIQGTTTYCDSTFLQKHSDDVGNGLLLAGLALAGVGATIRTKSSQKTIGL